MLGPETSFHARRSAKVSTGKNSLRESTMRKHLVTLIVAVIGLTAAKPARAGNQYFDENGGNWADT